MLSEIEFRSDRAGWASQVLTGENIKGGGGWAKSGTLLSLGGVGWGGGGGGERKVCFAQLMLQRGEGGGSGKGGGNFHSYVNPSCLVCPSPAGWKIERQLETLHCTILPSHTAESASQLVADLQAAVTAIKVWCVRFYA